MIQKNSSIQCADNIRILAAAMVEKANSGHPGGPMGGADFMHILYSEFLQFDPDNPHWRFRDRFFLDAGHMSAMLYGTLALLGNYSMEDLENFRQWGSPTPGHPEIDLERGIENTSGPLGLGHAFGIGAAIAERFLAARFGTIVTHKTFIYISDGGIQEEISQGAGRIAGHLGLGNITMFYDANDIQLSSETNDVTSEDTAKKYKAWNWHVITIDGNDHEEIRTALKTCIAETERPSLIIGKTTMGKGVRNDAGDLFEGKVEFHGKPLGKSSASYEKTITGLGGDPAHPFQIMPAVTAYYNAVKQTQRSLVSKRKKQFQKWVTDNPEATKKLDKFFTQQIPEIAWDSIKQKTNQATRNASSTVLSHLARKVENMIVASADLSNSDKTDGFLKETSIFKKGDFSGAFLQAGVAELTMSALATGMALHGGVIPVCATFFAFSDYMKPAIRVCALMEQQVIFIWTHDAFRVGEDGPTHQPIEQEAQLRLLEQLQNHSGNNSLLALRPADSNETTAAWKLALENTNSPTGLIFSRQDIKDLPPKTEQVSKGAYRAIEPTNKPDIILVANGSEVATLVEAAAILTKANNLNIAVVSAPSEGLFRKQSKAYQATILPKDIPTYGLTAGLPSTLRGLVGANGEVWGLNHFGYSAPYTVLDEKFGFTPKQVAAKILDFMKKK